MSINDITLTSSMRNNLLSLKNTSALLDRTQERLSTGKKVNSALDNPSSYFTAQSLNARASDLNNLLDSMGQAVQTINLHQRQHQLQKVQQVMEFMILVILNLKLQFLVRQILQRLQ